MTIARSALRILAPFAGATQTTGSRLPTQMTSASAPKTASGG